jgi:ribose 5-phosphate isomerase A
MDAKELAAAKAVGFIQDHMVIGLGSGSTATWAIHKIAERVRDGLQVQAIASSVASENLARELGIPMASSLIQKIDVTIDGADEVDDRNNLIKGGGGALLREKMLAYHSKLFIVIVDESKCVHQLGQFPLPLEVLPFALGMTLSELTSLGLEPVVREKDGKKFISDNGNLVIDCAGYKGDHPEDLNDRLHKIPGLIETGLFPSSLIDMVIIGNRDGSVNIRNVQD